MACNTKTTSVKVEPCKILWGRPERSCITPVFPVPAGSYFLISDKEVEYVFYDGTAADPATGAQVGIAVDYSVATNESEVCDALVIAMGVNFYVEKSDDELSVAVDCKEFGKIFKTIADGAVPTGFDLHVDAVGIGGDLGGTEGAIEMSMTTDSLDVSVNQSGTTLIDKFINGQNASISCTLAEMTEENWSLVVGKGLGNEFTPAAGTKVVGYGLADIGRSYFDLGGKLILHPVALPDTDRSRDITFWNTVADPESINFDSQAQQGMSVTFNALPDETIRGEVNLFAFGDTSQDLRA